MRFLFLTSAAVLASASVSAQTPTSTFTTPTTDGRMVTLEFFGDNIVKVTNTPAGYKMPATGIADPDAAWAPSTVIKVDTPTGMIATSPSGLTATVSAADGAVNISAGPDRAISDNGRRTSLPGGKQSMNLSTMGAGSFYGAGERGYSFNLAGDTLVVFNKQNYGYTKGEPRIKQMNIAMPLFLSSNGYAVVFDDFAAAEMVMSNPITYTTEAPWPISYYFINGAGTLEGVVREMSALTGRQDLPPFWALGYITSKYGYKTQRETLAVVDSLKQRNYPLDGIVLDLYWYGKEQDMGRLAWDPDQWPQYASMLKKLRKKGVNLIPISQPYVLRNGKALGNYTDLDARGDIFVKDSLGNTQEVKIWVGEGGMFDVSSPATSQWLTDRYKALTDDGGIAGWWGDLGEPEVHPETGLHANGLTARQYHNMYGNDWSRIVYDMFREHYPDMRPMALMRGGTTGLQRYSVFPWSTDVSRSWGGLQPQVTIMLNSGLSGLGYMSHDVGGFAIDPNHPTDPELYVRWLQMGLFTPILRTHAQFAAEPYQYPEYEHIIKPIIKARYAWLPYNYTLAYENATQGLPFVRPMNFYSPGSTALDDVDDQYLWGRDILVAPVMQQGATSRRIIFPEGGVWIDRANPTRQYHSGDTITYDAPLDVIPLFVRQGAFIPSADYDMDNTGDYRTDSYRVDYYPVKGVASAFTMFEDDRKSPASLADGKYALITFKGNDTGKEITIDITADGAYPGMPATREISLVVNNIDAPTAITVDGKPFRARIKLYDEHTRTLTLPVQLDKATSIVISNS